MTNGLVPAFADPVRASQATFRAILDAMARPGRIHTIEGLATPPHPLAIATAASVLTLVDGETTLWMDEQALASREWVSFHCGAPLTEASSARFAVALNSPSLDSFYAGSDEEPESSTTLILQVEALGSGQAFQLEGPGLEHSSILAVCGLSDRFATEWKANRRMFPRGIDVILCAANQLAALPRTVTLECA